MSDPESINVRSGQTQSNAASERSDEWRPPGEFDVEAEINRFRQRLLDLTVNNRLLHYKPSRTRTIQIVDELPNQIFDRLVTNGRSFGFLPGPGTPLFGHEGSNGGNALPHEPEDPARIPPRHQDDQLQTALSEDMLEGILNKIRTRARSAVEETGVNYLHLALGFLEWYESPDSDESRSAPLILVPVEIEKQRFDERRKKYVFRIKHTEEELQENVSLAEKLRQDFGLELPKYTDEQNPDTYFEKVTESIQSQPRWRVKREALVGFFTFSKILMFKDLDPRNWPADSLSQHPLINAVLAGEEREGADPLFASDYRIDEDPRADGAPLVVDADSSQHSALIDVADGKNLIIEGPPGTGKSQTITNVIAWALQSGRTVLFVSEKLAALEVVLRNLERVGLDQFCLPLHSDEAKAGKVVGSIDRRLKAKFTPPSNLQREIERYNRLKRQLLEYMEATSKTCGPYDQTVREVFFHVCELRTRGVEPVDGVDVQTNINAQQYESRVDCLDVLARHAQEVGPPAEHPWAGFNCLRFHANDEPKVADALRCLSETVKQLSDAANQFQQETYCSGFWTVEALVELPEDASKRIEPPAEGFSQTISAGIASGASLSAGDQLVELLKQYKQAAAACKPHMTGPVEDSFETGRTILRIAAHVPEQLLEQTLSEIKSLPGRYEALLESLQKIRSLQDQVHDVSLQRPDTLYEFQQSLTLLRLLTDPVANQQEQIVSGLFNAGVVEVLSKARDLSDALSKRYEELNHVIDIKDAPDDDELRDLRQTLQSLGRSRFRFLSSQYRQAKRQALRFANRHARFHPVKFADHLARLEEFRTKAAAFEKHQSLIRDLGPLFRGIRTDWPRLDGLAQWIHAVVERGFTRQRVLDCLTALHRMESLEWIDELADAVDRAKREFSEPVVQADCADFPAPVEATSLDRLIDIAVSQLGQRQQLVDAARSFRMDANDDLRALAQVAQQVATMSETAAKIDRDQTFKDLCGADFQGPSTDIRALEVTLAWRRSLDPLNMPSEMTRWLCAKDTPARARTLREILSRVMQMASDWRKALQRLREFGDLDEMWLCRADNELGTSEALLLRLEKLKSQAHLLPLWAEYVRAADKAKELGLKPFVNSIAEGRLSPERAKESYELLFWKSVAQRVIESDRRLSSFSRIEHEEARKQFRDLDKQLNELKRKDVARKAAERRPPSGVSTGRVAGYTEMGLIRHEIGKTKRHCRIRRLMKRAPKSVQTLKPCLMMSPLSVAQFLPPGKIEFDLVVMDEASQIKPQDALGTLARARMAVIVGDPKQLPPTSFFDRLEREEVDENDETVLDDSESVLEVGMKAFGTLRRLKWHYRSRHESLIDFSNYHFYDGELVVFPSPSDEAGELGVSLHTVDGGSFHHGRNDVEAQVVAEAIAKHALEHPDESLGVGAFNMKQRDLIQEHLDRLCASDPEARAAVEQNQSRTEPIFIKNLENLQGDERDVIFISYTYGPDPQSGRVFQRFGPITLANGWRRLNVLITRAKKRVEVFSSMRPEEILGGSDKSRGVNAMKDYLTYAQTGKIPDRGHHSGRPPDSPFEIAVARVVQEMGLEVVPQVGVAGYFIDIGVLGPERRGEFLLGVECDGAAYHSAKSARDRDRLREEVIKSRGWRLHRIWSTDWFRNQATEVERLRQAINEALCSATFQNTGEKSASLLVASGEDTEGDPDE